LFKQVLTPFFVNCKKGEAMTAQPTIREIDNRLKSLRNSWMHANEFDKGNGRKGRNEKFRAWQSYRDNIDVNLATSLKAAMKWIKENNSRVYWSSSFTNCYDIDNALRDYHGINCGWEKASDEAFVPSTSETVNPKSIILVGYAFAVAMADKQKDILGAGGLDTSHVDKQF
jgi:hypothetical protein